MRVDAGRLWGGGFVTSVLAGLAAVVVFLFASQVLAIDIEVERPGQDEVVLVTAGAVFALSFAAGLLATATLHVFLRFVPRPVTFFGLLCLLVFLGSLLAPLTLATNDAATGWLIIIHLVVFLMITGPLLGLARTSALPRPGAPA